MITGIIGAMDIEVKELISSMADVKKETVSGIDFYRGRLKGKDLVVARCGIGKVYAAVCAQTMILKYEPDLIINTGVAGSLSNELNIGDIVISDGVVQHDYDASPIGIPAGMIAGIDLIKIPCNEELVKKIVKAAQILKDTRVARGTGASGDQFVCCNEKKDTITNTFDALCVEMEGGAIGQVCYINNVDFCIIRAMSDKADGSAHMDFDAFVDIAVEKTILIIKNFLAEL